MTIRIKVEVFQGVMIIGGGGFRLSAQMKAVRVVCDAIVGVCEDVVIICAGSGEVVLVTFRCKWCLLRL